MKLRLSKGHLKLYYGGRGKRKCLYLERVLLAITILSLIPLFIINLLFSGHEEKTVIKELKTVNKTVVMAEPNIIEEVVVQPIVTTISKQYRLTSYYNGDNTGSTHITGSGLTTKSFQVNDKGWYTYNGKLVIAAATEELLNSSEYAYDKAMHTRVDGRTYFRYFDEVTITIDGVDYEAIVLDSCGASMKVSEDRIDLFVSSSYNKIDRGYKGINAITVTMEVE